MKTYTKKKPGLNAWGNTGSRVEQWLRERRDKQRITFICTRCDYRAEGRYKSTQQRFRRHMLKHGVK